jgi:hypothetical protein
MLMLVVVIIIAAVVSAGASGLAGSQKTPAKMTLIEAEFYSCGILQLTHNGGEPIIIKDHTFFLTLDKKKYPVIPAIFIHMHQGEPEVIETLMPQQTVHTLGRWNSEPTHVFPYTELIGKTAKLEIFDKNGLPIAADEFIITRDCDDFIRQITG